MAMTALMINIRSIGKCLRKDHPLFIMESEEEAGGSYERKLMVNLLWNRRSYTRSDLKYAYHWNWSQSTKPIREHPIDWHVDLAKIL